MEDQHGHNVGTLASVRGSVVDVVFPQKLPEFYNELRAGENLDVVIEVVFHLGPDMVRGIALTPTAGLGRGTQVIDLGRRLRVPVGERLLGRVLNVFGETIDGEGDIPGAEWRPLHGPTMPLNRQAARTEILETGIKAIDLLAPLERGGKAGLFPADDFTDPAVTHTFGHLSALIVLSRERASQGLYPAIDPLRSESKMLTPPTVGVRHYHVAR